MSQLQELQICSWNIREKSASPAIIDGLLSIMAGMKNKVICLQEVPHKFLAPIQQIAKKRGLNSMYQGRDKLRRFTRRDTRDCYLVILTDLPVDLTKTWVMSDTSKRPWITNFTIPLLRFFRKWDGTTIKNDALLVDIIFANRRVRVITAHLSLTEPAVRRKEFQTLLDHQEQGIPTIICGDFNILEGITRFVANLAIGGSIHYALSDREREEFDALISKLELNNPLSGLRTHAAGQLDHILHTSHMEYVRRKTFGAALSDHKPVYVALALA